MKGALLESNFAIRPFSADDIPEVFALAERSPGAARWSRADYERVCGDGLDGWVVVTRSSVEQSDASRIVGFIVARRMADEMEILNLAVEAAFRRRSMASRLLEVALELGRASGAKSVFLEARACNAGAIAFYERQEFTRAGHRPGYYSDPPEDAVVLSRALFENQ